MNEQWPRFGEEVVAACEDGEECHEVNGAG